MQETLGFVAAAHQVGMEAATEVSTDAAEGEEFEFQAAE